MDPLRSVRSTTALVCARRAIASSEGWPKGLPDPTETTAASGATAARKAVDEEVFDPGCGAFSMVADSSPGQSSKRFSDSKLMSAAISAVQVPLLMESTRERALHVSLSVMTAAVSGHRHVTRCDTPPGACRPLNMTMVSIPRVSATSRTNAAYALSPGQVPRAESHTRSTVN